LVNILLISVMRDEGPHLIEWIAHHRALGVTDFLIYTNECTDGTVEMLRALAPFGVVQRDNPGGGAPQWAALKAAWKTDQRKAADWILGIDCDEFIALKPPLTSLLDLIEAVGDADAIALPWRLFGSSGERLLRNVPTTTLFTRAAPENIRYPASARHIKTLCRARGPFGQLGVHRPKLKRGKTARWCNGSGEEMPEAFAQNEQTIIDFAQNYAAKQVQLNHYSLRSAQSFMLKRARGLPNKTGKPIDLMYWAERNFNTVVDRSIVRHRARSAAVQREMLGVPGLADFQAKAHAHHHSRFAEILRDPIELTLYGRALLTGDSTVLSAAEQATLLRAVQAIHG